MIPVAVPPQVPIEQTNFSAALYSQPQELLPPPALRTTQFIQTGLASSSQTEQSSVSTQNDQLSWPIVRMDLGTYPYNTQQVAPLSAANLITQFDRIRSQSVLVDSHPINSSEPSRIQVSQPMPDVIQAQTINIAQATEVGSVNSKDGSKKEEGNSVDKSQSPSQRRVRSASRCDLTLETTEHVLLASTKKLGASVRIWRNSQRNTFYDCSLGCRRPTHDRKSIEKHIIKTHSLAD
jgi:hypothetical protein